MLASALIIYFIPLAMSQLLVIILGGVAGLYCVHTAKLAVPIVIKDQPEIQKTVSTPFRAYYWLLIFVGLFILLLSCNGGHLLLLYKYLKVLPFRLTGIWRRTCCASSLIPELVTSRLIEESNFELGYAFAQLVPDLYLLLLLTWVHSYRLLLLH